VLRSGGSVSDVGFVTGAGLLPTVLFLLFGGVLADRLPRQQVMLAANLGQGSAQAAFAVLILAGHAHLWQMVALSALRGRGNGLYFPASQGLLPQTVPSGQLSPANAIRRLGQNGAQIGGAALGGVVVALAGPGWGLAADASSFAAAAALRTGMSFPALARRGGSTMLAELGQGWHAFTARRWLWAIVVQFGLINALFSGCFNVIGPVVADRHLGGAGSWGAILATESVGAVLGAALMLRYRPERLLLVASLGAGLFVLPLVALATIHVVAIIAAAALLSGVGGEVFEVNWSIALQEQIPLELLSRVAAYDAFGSFALSPLGTILVGPVALALGITTTLAGGGVLVAASAVVILCVPEVRNLRRRPAPGSEPAEISGAGQKTGHESG
jgi:hypothetical protein